MKKYKNPKKTKKTSYKKSKKFGKKIVRDGAMVVKAGGGVPRSPFPPNLFTTLTYTHNARLEQATTDVPEIYTYRMNGCYDPDQTSTGIQPRYYDTLCGAGNTAAPYYNYRVHSCKIECVVFPVYSDANVGGANGLFAIIPRRTTVGTPATLDEMRERPYGKYIYTTVVNAAKPQKITHYMKVKDMLGHKDIMDVDATAARYDANPSEELYWDIAACNIASTGEVALDVLTTITYYVQFYTLNDVANS